MDLNVGDEDEDETEKPSGSRNVMNFQIVVKSNSFIRSFIR